MNKKLFVLFFGIALLSFIGYAAIGAAEVNISVGINVPPPAFVIAAPPVLILIPGTYAYFVADIDVDIVFFHGYWYRPFEGRWYRAAGYNGPWVFVAPARVPGVLLHLPPGFRHNIPPGHERIPYGQLKKNWRTWEREKHWERHEMKERKHEMKERHEEGEGRGRGRHHGEE